LAQKDLKRMIAYSSVSHMGFCLLGMASFTQQGIDGAVLNLWTHGLISPMLFLIAGVIYDRAHHRNIEGFGGLAQQVPEYAGLMGLAFFASLGLPGLCGFVSEFTVFLGSLVRWQTLTILSAVSVLLPVAVLAVLVQDVVVRRSPRRVGLLTIGALFWLALTALATWRTPWGNFPIFGGLLVHDPLRIFFAWLFLAAALLTVVIVPRSK